ncbi:MAG TPA: VLRF1 family aeRF1-type release factor [Virgibacillus sp.]|nr:VLRF1 family aeRF1-type release factor [Virgibacillus sp.]
MSIMEQVNQLENMKSDRSKNVFTMYLNTDPTDPDQQGGKWKINLKNGLQNFEQYLKKDENPEELKKFQSIKEKVTAFVHDNEQNLQRGIIVFATADEEVWFADLVQTRLTTEFFWKEKPELAQIQSLIHDFPMAGIILVQQNEVKVIETSVNQIHDTTYYELDVDTDSWRLMSGPRPSHTPKGPGSSNLQMEKFEARFDANLHRWYKSIAPKLSKKAKDNQWERIYVVGEGKAAQEIKKQINRPHIEVIQKNMLDHKDVSVLKEVFG